MAGFRLLAAALSIALPASALECEAPLVDLHVFLYSGVVRDLDPDFFGSNSGDSDAACQMTVEPADSSLDVKEVRLSDILLNSNEPDFKMFFEFGCHEIDSIFTMVCYDWDPNQPVVRAGEEVFIADPVTQWPKSGVKQTLVDNLDTKFTFTYKFVYGNNLNADGATEDDDVPIVRGDPVSSKKKKSDSIDLGLAIGVLIAAVILAFCCGAACCVYRRRKDDPVAEVNGMEMGEVTLHASSEPVPEATVKAVEVPPPGPPPDYQGTPNPVRAEGEMI